MFKEITYIDDETRKDSKCPSGPDSIESEDIDGERYHEEGTSNVELKERKESSSDLFIYLSSLRE